jgi:hypothetical protein
VTLGKWLNLADVQSPCCKAWMKITSYIEFLLIVLNKRKALTLNKHWEKTGS